MSAVVAPEVTAATATTAPILFFDGECGFCDRAIRFSMSQDVHGRLYAATLAGETAQRLLAPFADMLRHVDSTVLYLPATTEREATVQIHSDAALSVLRLLGGVWGVLGVAGLLVPRWLRDAAYKAFAKRRFRFFGGWKRASSGPLRGARASCRDSAVGGVRALALRRRRLCTETDRRSMDRHVADDGGGKP